MIGKKLKMTSHPMLTLPMKTSSTHSSPSQQVEIFANLLSNEIIALLGYMALDLIKTRHGRILRQGLFGLETYSLSTLCHRVS